MDSQSIKSIELIKGNIINQINTSLYANSFGDKSKVPVMSTEGILIRLKNVDHQFISHTYYVPALKPSILSIGQLLEKGNGIEMNKGGLVMRDGKGRLIAKVQLSTNKMFKLKINCDNSKCLKVFMICQFLLCKIARMCVSAHVAPSNIMISEYRSHEELGY